MRVLLAARPEGARDAAQPARDGARRDGAWCFRLVHRAHVSLELAVEAVARGVAALRVRAVEAGVGERRRVREALQHRVHEARVPQVGEAWPGAADLAPLEQAAQRLGREEVARRRRRQVILVRAGGGYRNDAAVGRRRRRAVAL